MNRHLDPAVGSSWYSVYQNVVSIEQTGDREVTVTEASADSQFNLAMGGSAGVIESAATLAEKGADYGNSTGGVNCTGPFSFGEWKSGESLTLERYDDYWDDTLRARSGEVKFVFMNDANARVNALKSGDVDGGWMLPYEGIAQLKSSGTGDVYFGLNTAVSSLIVSNLEGPLGDERVRKALLMALDREGIVEAASKGYGEVTNALTTESVWVGASEQALADAFEGLEEYPYDVEAAKQLIEEAGATGEEIVLATAPISSDFAVIAQATAAAAESIGLKATIQTVTPNAYTALFSDPARTRGRRPVLHRLVPVEPRPARDVQRAAHRRVQQLRQLEQPRVRPGRERGDRHRRRRGTVGEDGRGPAHRERGAAVAARSTPRPCRCSSVSASRASRRRSPSCTTPGRPQLVHASAIRQRSDHSGGAAVAS